MDNEKITSKLYAERAIKNLERMFKIPDECRSGTIREIVRDIVSAAILVSAEIQKEAMGIIMQNKD